MHIDAWVAQVCACVGEHALCAYGVYEVHVCAWVVRMYLHVCSVSMHVTWAVCISMWDVHVFVGMTVHCVHVHVCVLHMYVFISAMYLHVCAI